MSKFQSPMLNNGVCRATTDKQTHKQTHKHTNKHTNKQPTKHTNERPNEQTHKQTHKQTNKHILIWELGGEPGEGTCKGTWKDISYQFHTHPTSLMSSPLTQPI